MNRLQKPAFAVGGALVLLLVLALAVAASAIFTGVGAPTLNSGNWEWSGSATLDNPHKYVCVTFPGSILPDYDCTDNIAGAGATPFTCSVPASAFSGVVGIINWQISAFPNTGCGGTEVGGPSGTFTPSAVSLVTLGSTDTGGMTYAAVLLGALLLVSGILMWRRGRLLTG